MKINLSKIKFKVVLPIIIALILSSLPFLVIFIKHIDTTQITFLRMFVSFLGLFFTIIINATILYWVGKKVLHFEKNLFSTALWYYILLEILPIILFSNNIILFFGKVTISAFLISIIRFLISAIVGIILLKYLYKIKTLVAVQACVYMIIVKFIIGLLVLAVTSPILSIISNVKQTNEQNAYLSEKNPVIEKFTNEFKSPQIIKDIKLSYQYKKDGFGSDSTIYDWVVVLESGRYTWIPLAGWSGEIQGFNEQQKKAFLSELDKKLIGKTVELKLDSLGYLSSYVDTTKYFNNGVIADDLNYPFPVDMYLNSKQIDNSFVNINSF